MSNVYRATDRILERTVAVKILAEHLSDDERFVARFRREALAVAKLIHPNIVQVYDTGVDDESPLHRHGVRRGPLRRPDPAAQGRARPGDRGRRSASRPAPGSTTRTGGGSSTATSSPGNLMVIGGPRAGGGGRRDDSQADRLRDRPRGRADPDHPGRLGRRDRRLPGARAGAWRGGDPGDRRLRARRRPLPVPHRPPALRGLLAGRAGGAPAERAPAAADAPTTTRSRRRSAPRCCNALEGDPRRRYASAGALAAGLGRGGT